MAALGVWLSEETHPQAAPTKAVVKAAGGVCGGRSIIYLPVYGIMCTTDTQELCALVEPYLLTAG